VTKSSKDSTAKVRAPYGKLYPYKGEMLSCYAIAKAEGVTPQMISYRLKKYGCASAFDIREIHVQKDLNKLAEFVAKQATRPKKIPKYLQKYAYRGEQLTLVEIAKREYTTVNTIARRLKIFGSTEKDASSHCSLCKSPDHRRPTCTQTSISEK
jgi:hypothetical protein